MNEMTEEEEAALDADLERLKPKETGDAPTTAQTPVETNPDGQFGRQTFGSYVRVTNQKTGEQTWEDLQGNAVEAPKSMQMLEAANAGLSPNSGTAASWDEAIKRQNTERVAKAEAYAQKMIQSNRQARENRQTRLNKQNAMTGDLVGAAMADLGENMRLAQAGAQNMDGGRFYKAKDGNFYVRGIVRPEALDGFNAESAKYGGRDKAERIVASQRVDKYGNAIGEATFAVLYRKNGNVNDKGDGVYVKQLTLGQAIDAVYKAQVAMGMPELDAKNYASRQFGGANPFNWDLDAGTNASVRTAKIKAESDAKIQELRNAGDLATQKERNKSGAMSEERMQLERERLAQRKSEEEGRNVRAGSKNNAASVRLAASVAKNMKEIRRGLKLDDEQAAMFQASLTKILTDALGGGEGDGGEAKPAGDGKEEQPQFKEGDVQEINGVKMKLLPSKKDPKKLTWQRI